MLRSVSGICPDLQNDKSAGNRRRYFRNLCNSKQIRMLYDPTVYHPFFQRREKQYLELLLLLSLKIVIMILVEFCCNTLVSIINGESAYGV